MTTFGPFRMSKRSALNCLAVLSICTVGIFGPDVSRFLSSSQVDGGSRQLLTEEAGGVDEVNGDPLIMGLSGQLFKFMGRTGAWYSAVSTKSFQWNMLLQNYEDCPKDANTFVSGAGFTFFKDGKISKRIEVNVANPYYVDVGCGTTPEHCLGAGSLELIIDGVKHTVGGDYTTKDGEARIVAFNTFHDCSRRFYDFDVQTQRKLRGDHTNNVFEEPTIFDVIEGLKKDMVNKDRCEAWIQDRVAYSDLFQQPGHCSTVIVKTQEVTMHMEYKQENERCNAHSIDVWISSVSPALFDEDWEGIIGETKDSKYAPDGKQTFVERSKALKYASDDDYEVNSPFAAKCKGCFKR